MTRSPHRIVGIFGVLLAAWVLTYWLYQPAEPPITYGSAPAGLSAPLAAVESVPMVAAPSSQAAQPPAPQPKPPAQPIQAVEAPRFREYTVQRGDISFQAISQRVYGTTAHADAISRANPLVTPDRLRIGRTVLNIPVDPANIQGRVVTINPAEQRTTASPTQAPAPPAATTATYVVQPGDTLSDIAKKIYGKSALWQKIADANKDRVPDPARLRAGVTLRIPPE
jgi:nucleoid-associated protein YgaU